MLLSKQMRLKLLSYFEDDLGNDDVTTALVEERKTKAVINTNEECVLAGIEESLFLLQALGIKTKPIHRDGEWIKPGPVLKIEGSNKTILQLERTVLNILARMSGVASVCANSQKIAGKTRLALTRKTMPGFNLFDKKAAAIAGIEPHRLNLSEMILLKENHLIFFDSVTHALKKARENAGGKKIEIEVENERQALEAVPYADVIMLDNFTSAQARKTIKALRSKEKTLGKKTVIELSGGINLRNLRAYSKLGADLISMGGLTQNAPSIDFSLDFEGVK